MCGIFGFLTNDASRFPLPVYRRTLDDLFRLSESRGKEAAGLALRTDKTVFVHKQPLPASRMIRTGAYRSLFDAPRWPGEEGGISAVGHSRLVTDGTQQRHRNNQPVVKGRVVGVHNGIIVNAPQLWQRHRDIPREGEVDTEIFLGLFERYLQQEAGDLAGALRLTYDAIEGNASVALIPTDIPVVILATNNGSLYHVRDRRSRAMLFASERFILQKLIRRSFPAASFDPGDIQQLRAQTACVLDLTDFKPEFFGIADTASRKSAVRLDQPLTIEDVSPGEQMPSPSTGEEPWKVPRSWTDHYLEIRQRVAGLTRCTRCLLPQTVPFIDFDETGVCNYCREYRPIEVLGPETFRRETARFRRTDGRPDCLVALSGGRDSCYALHTIKRELGMNPAAYSYDWGMLTDLARRNQSRMCGKLGVEHILVSADIVRKRANIRANVLAWLERPKLGTVPLFMAGDKQYFAWGQRLKRQLGVPLLVMGENLLEETNFKTGFSGIRKEDTSSHSYALSFKNRLKMAGYYAAQALRHPAYLNASIMDSAEAFFSYYFIRHAYVNLYRYVPWNEQTVQDLLIREYNWETAPDTSATWRIGDGTAAFYNYIYYMLAGFTENDTFRSNQVREGMLTRQRAMVLVEEENRPRFEAIAWYCRTVGIDAIRTVERINAVPGLLAPASFARGACRGRDRI